MQIIQQTEDGQQVQAWRVWTCSVDTVTTDHF